MFVVENKVVEVKLSYPGFLELEIRLLLALLVYYLCIIFLSLFDLAAFAYPCINLIQRLLLKYRSPCKAWDCNLSLFFKN